MVDVGRGDGNGSKGRVYTLIHSAGQMGWVMPRGNDLRLTPPRPTGERVARRAG